MLRMGLVSSPLSFLVVNLAGVLGGGAALLDDALDGDAEDHEDL